MADIANGGASGTGFPVRRGEGATAPSAPVWLAPLLVVAAMALPLIVLTAVFVTNGTVGGHPPAKRLLSPGMEAPDFSLPTADARTIHLKNYKGRPIFLAFVPSWTDEKSIAEIRSLAASTATFDSAGAKIICISPDTTTNGLALQQREKPPFPLLTDADNAVSKRYGVAQGGFRTTFVITPDGMVKYRFGDASVDAAKHGPQLIAQSKCCLDEVIAARAHGIGKTVGEFSLPRADKAGAMETICGDGTQVLTVVFFLSVKCPCSNSYNERIAAMMQQFGQQPVRLVGIYSNEDETQAEIAAHAQKSGFAFPVYRDERALGAEHFGAKVTPEVFVLDKQRALRYAGRIDDNRIPAKVQHPNLLQAMQSLLTEKSPTVADTPAFGCAIVRSK